MNSNPMLLRDIYAFNRLVFVNSCGHAYTELQLDQNVAMTGSNNAGKTSSLSALKFFILPEVNFKDCGAKFDFKSGGQQFGSHESFQYYFPCNESFIVLDAENTHGKFCVILSRGSGELSYARTFIAKPYDQIKHCFWQFDDNGIGQPKEQLSRDSVKAALIEHSPVFISDVDSIKSAIYQENSIDPRLGRYCLVPLPDGGSVQEVKALRALTMMAFDSSQAKGESLPEAIATIIEGERRSAKEKLSVRLDDIIEEYSQLNTESARLNKLEDNRHNWQEAGETRKAFRVGLAEAAQLLSNLNASINVIKEEIEAQKSEFDDELAQRKAAHDTAKELLSEALSESNQLTGELKPLRGMLKDLGVSVASVEAMRRQYPGYGDEEIIEILKDVINEMTIEKESLESEEERDKEWSRLRLKQRSDQQELERKRAELASLAGATLSGLSPHAASTLRSLNSRLAGCRETLLEDQVEVIESFAGQFKDKDGQIAWLGYPLPGVPFASYNPDDEKSRLKREISELEGFILKVGDRIKKLSDGAKLTKPERETKLAELEKALHDTKKDIQLIKAYDLNAEKLPQMREECQQKEEQAEIKRGLVARRKEEDSAASSSLSEIKVQVDDLNRRLTDLTANKAYVDKVALYEFDGFTAMVNTMTSVPVKASTIEQTINTFAKKCNDVSDAYRTFMLRIKKLVREQIVEGIPVDVADRDDISVNEVQGLFDKLSADFANLDELRQNHEANILTHNQTTNNTISELKANKSSIDAFEEEINDEFGGRKISDLTDIKVHIEVDQRFTDLLKDIEYRFSRTLDSATLADKGFYDSLGSFVRDYFTNSRHGNTLNLHNVIRKVNFSYKRGDVSENKPQSTGTTNMFVAVLLSVLLQRLIPGGTELHMPLVMDEVADLDAANLKTLLDVLEKYHFNLFSATPEISGLLAHLIGRWVEIGTLRIANPYAPDCTCIWMDGSNELLEAV